MKDASDIYLTKFLSECNGGKIFALIGIMKSRFSSVSRKLAKQYSSKNQIPKARSKERLELAEEIGNLLRWYGSNAFAYAARQILAKIGGTHYHKILRDTARVLNKARKRKYREELPRVASVKDWEDLICSIVIKSSLDGKNPDEIGNMLKEAGFEKEAAKEAAERYGPGGAVGAMMPVVVKILGKGAVKCVIELVIIKITQQRLGREAAALLAKRLLVGVAQKAIAKILTGAGGILLAIDITLFAASPARRITVPTVVFISALRARERLSHS